MALRTLTLHSRMTAALLAALAALPMLVVAIPGMTDLPNHTARFRVFQAAGHGGPLDALFAIRWRWVGNLGVDLPVRLLDGIFGVELATRLVVAAIAPLGVLGVLALSRAAHGRVAASATVALALVLSHPWYYGFVNYCMSVSLALLVAAAWIARPPVRPLRATGFGLAALVVWTAHLGGWAILLMIVGGAELVRLRAWREIAPRMLAALPLFLPLVPLFVWRTAGKAQLFNYGGTPVGQKLMAFVTMLNGIDRWFDVGTALVMLALAGLALLWAGGRRIEPRLAAGAVLVTLATLAVPSNVMESWGADMRMAPVAVMLAILAIGPATTPGRERIVAIAGLALFLLRDAVTIAVWAARSERLEARLVLLDDVPRGARVGFVSAEANCRVPWPTLLDHTLAVYAVIRRDAFVNTMFHVEGTDLVWPRRPIDAVRWTAASQDVKASCPAGVVDRPAVAAKMAQLAADGYDRIWLTGTPPASVPVPAGFAIIREVAGDTMYAGRK